MDVLNRHGNEMKLSDLGDKTRQFDADERNRILDILEKNGQILRYKEKVQGKRPWLMVRRIG